MYDYVHVQDNKCLDVGCGAGFMAELMSKAGGKVVALDINEELLRVGRKRAEEQLLDISYLQCDVADNIDNIIGGGFEIITCFDLVEHLLDWRVLVKNLSEVVAKNGLIFVTTFDKSLASFLLGIVVAEYIFKLAPRGSHSYHSFIRPADLVNEFSKYGISVIGIHGLGYNPLTKSFKFKDSIDSHYLAVFQASPQ